MKNPTSVLAVVLLVLVAGASPSIAGGSNCPNWIAGAPSSIDSSGSDTVPECWAPLVTYRENLALLHGDVPVYVTRIELLTDNEHTFDTRAELEAYVQSVLLVRGFWFDHFLKGRVLIPPSTFDLVEARQIIDRPRIAGAAAAR